MRMKRFTTKFPRNGLDGLPYGYDDGISVVNGKSGGDTQTVQQADPWAGQMPYLKDVYRSAQDRYADGAQTYPNIDPLAPLSGTTQGALQNMAVPNSMDVLAEGTAGTALNTINQQAGSPGVYGAFDPAVAAGAQATQGIIQNSPNPSQVYNFGQGEAQAAVGTRTQQAADQVDPTGTINQMMNFTQDPYVQQQIEMNNQKILQDTLQSRLMPAEMAAMQSGSYGGSGLQKQRANIAGEAVDSMERNTNNLYLQSMDRSLSAAGMAANMQGAADQADISRYQTGIQGSQAIDSFANSGANRTLAATNTALGASQFGDQQQLAAANSAAQNIPALQEVPQTADRRALAVGSFYDQRAQAERDAEISRALYDQQAPDAALQNYANLVMGNSGGGTTTTTAQGGGASPIAGAVGGASAGAGIAAAAGVASGPIGWALIGGTALLGAYGSS